MAIGTNYDSVRATMADFDPNADEYATRLVDTLLAAAVSVKASDVHLQPVPQGLEIRWRIDGVLHCLGEFSRGKVAHPVTRLKVMADLLTYRMDVPQEGRIRTQQLGVEFRVSTFPTLHGERAVIRLLSDKDQPWLLDDLGLPDDIRGSWGRTLFETSGALLITGPAGSGKTTTAYASLRQIVADTHGGRSVVSLEDPIESAIAGVSQSQVNVSAGFGLTSGLRSLLRQDPQVIFVGEIRDREAAYVAFQAALTGQLVISTFHANSAASAICRLFDMGIEPYLLRSGILKILGQRLVRKLCACKTAESDKRGFLGLPLQNAFKAVGCANCHGTGYQGRVLLAECLTPRGTELSRSLLSKSDAAAIESLAIQTGMRTNWDRAIQSVEAGLTSASEIRRTLGLDLGVG